MPYSIIVYFFYILFFVGSISGADASKPKASEPKALRKIETATELFWAFDEEEKRRRTLKQWRRFYLERVVEIFDSISLGTVATNVCTKKLRPMLKDMPGPTGMSGAASNFAGAIVDGYSKLVCSFDKVSACFAITRACYLWMYVVKHKACVSTANLAVKRWVETLCDISHGFRSRLTDEFIRDSYLSFRRDFSG